MSDEELNDAIEGFTAAIGGFMEVANQFWLDVFQTLASVTGYHGDVTWPPTDEFLDYMIGWMDTMVDHEELSVEDRAELICQLEQIRADREGDSA